MLAFSNDYYGMIFRATQSVELFCAYIFNIIDNAIEYKVYGDKIMCFIGQKDDSYIFTICNEKGEFSSQVLENGTKLFFTSNNNRN